MGDSARFREQIPADAYTGLLADAYDAWLPPGVEFPDDRLYQRVIAEAGGTALELGTGNGRFLIVARQRGLDVEGLEASADMIAHCRRHASERVLDIVVHHGDFAPLALDRRYAAIVCPAGSFTLVADIDRATEAVAGFHRHLVPGGRLAMGCRTETRPVTGTGFTWRLRRTGTDPATGTTYVAHEATGPDDGDPAVQLHFGRVEAYDRGGRLVETRFSRLRLRSWTRDELGATLGDAGFGALEFSGDDQDWVVVAAAE